MQSIDESHSAVINADMRPVYSLADYVEEHPGGIPLLLEVGGQDGTQAFEDVGHSDDAREMLEPFLIGEVASEVCDFKFQCSQLHVMMLSNAMYVYRTSMRRLSHISLNLKLFPWSTISASRADRSWPKSARGL